MAIEIASAPAERGWMSISMLALRQRRGVYAVGHTALAPRAHAMAAVLAAGAGAVLSHVSAAALHGIRPSASSRHDVTVADRRRGPSGVRVHHAALPPGDVTVVDGIPVTTIERTLLDLAAVLRPPALRHAPARSTAGCTWAWARSSATAAGTGPSPVAGWRVARVTDEQIRVEPDALDGDLRRLLSPA